jgi:NTE family protein
MRPSDSGGSTAGPPDPPAATPLSALLAGLPPEELQRVQSRLSATTCEAGAVLLSQGSWAGVLYILRTGMLSVDLETADGELRHLNRLIPGECAGEMSLLTGSPASATVSTLVDSDLWTLRHADFVELLATCPGLARNVSVVLSQRLSIANRRRQPGVARLMRLRVHPAAPSGLGEAIARAVAEHTTMPLLVLDDRPHGSWTPAERLPALTALIGDREVAERLRPDKAERVLATRVDNTPAETWVRLQRWLPEYVTHVLLLTGSVQRPAEVLHYPGALAADVTLWPEHEQQIPAGVADIALLTDEERVNTRDALERASTHARVVRTLAPAGSDAAKQRGWLARHLAGLKVGIAFGAGGARGFAHLGVLRALRRAAVPIDYIAGCSVGAVVATGFALGLDVDTIVRHMVDASAHAVKLTIPRHSLLSSGGFERFFRKVCGEARFEDLALPLAVVAVDILERREVVLERGLVWKGVLASMSIPGIYPPVWVGDRCLVDGGLLNPLPASVARGLGGGTGV